MSRTFCWNCARLTYYGDTQDPVLLARAEACWEKSDKDLPMLALSMTPIPRWYRFRSDRG